MYLAREVRVHWVLVYEHKNECRAIEVIGQDWSSEVVALVLEDWELGRVAGETRDAHGFPLFTVVVSGRFLAEE